MIGPLIASKLWVCVATVIWNIFISVSISICSPIRHRCIMSKPQTKIGDIFKKVAISARKLVQPSIFLIFQFWFVWESIYSNALSPSFCLLFWFFGRFYQYLYFSGRVYDSAISRSKVTIDSGYLESIWKTNICNRSRNCRVHTVNTKYVLNGKAWHNSMKILFVYFIRHSNIRRSSYTVILWGRRTKILKILLPDYLTNGKARVRL